MTAENDAYHSDAERPVKGKTLPETCNKLHPENDADREAFEAFDAALEAAWDEFNKGNPLEGASSEFASGFTAGAAHARQPGEPVAWIKTALDTLAAYEADYGEPLPDDHELGRIDESAGSSSFRIRVGHIRHLAKLTHPAPVAVPEAMAPTDEPDFVQSLQGFASMCESSARTGGLSPDDCNMVAGKLRDASFLIDTLQKLRDGKIALGWQLVPASPSPASPEKGTERLREALAKALEIVCTCIAFSRRDTGTERASSTLYDLGSECIKAEAAIRAALATFRAQPEGDDTARLFGSILKRGAACAVTDEVKAVLTEAPHPTAPKPAEVRGLAPVSRCLGFFASVIKSGEPWTETCQREYDAAISALEPSPAPEAKPLAGGIERAAEYLCRTAFHYGYAGIRDDGSIRDRGYEPVVFSQWGGPKFQGHKDDLRAMVREIVRLAAGAGEFQRGAEAERKSWTDAADTLIESLQEGIMTDAGIKQSDRDKMQAQIDALDALKAEMDSLPLTSGEG